MAWIWHRTLTRIISMTYFDRIEVIRHRDIPAGEPVLYIASHRNGAVDGFVYLTVAPRAVPLVSRQWTSSPLGRIFLSGIEVVRRKDAGDRGRNTEALRQCSEYLLAGGEVLIFPEGTSSLRPGHLPFKSGAARIAREYLHARKQLTVIPLGVSYELPWAFRSRARVIVGSPIILHGAGPTGSPTLGEIRTRIETALERTIHEADQTTWGTPRSGASAWLAMPIVGLGMALNCIPLACGAWAGRVLPDDTNVISLWKILVGAPAFTAWIGLWIGASAILGSATLLAGYLLATALSLFLYRAVSGPLRHREHRHEAV